MTSLGNTTDMRGGGTAGPPVRRWQAFSLLAIAAFMTAVDLTIVNVALPTIGARLHFPESDLQWVVTAYALTFGGFLLLGGRAADLLGRRRVLMAGLVIFAAASLGCALAGGETFLIVMRGVQGLGAALLLPAALSIVMNMFGEGAERNKALGLWGGIGASGATVGLLAGGALTRYAGWQYIFYLNVAVTVAVLLLTRRVVPESRRDEARRRYDPLGAISATGALVAFVYATSTAPAAGWTGARTLALLATSVALLGCFLVIETRAQAPLLPLRLFRLRTLAGSNAVGFLLGASFYSFIFTGTLYMQQVLGYSALKTGLAWLATSVTGIALAGPAQLLVTRASARLVMAAGMALVGGGILWATQIPANGNFWSDLAGPFFLAGAVTWAFIPVSIGALTGVSERDAGVASGLIDTSQQLGGAIGIAIASTVAATHSRVLLGQGHVAAAALTGGFRWALWVSGLTALAAVPVAFTLIKGRNRPLTQKLRSGHPQSSRWIALADRPRVRQLLGLGCHSCASSRFRDSRGLPMPKYTRPALVGLAAVSAAALCAVPALAASAKSAGPAHPHTAKHVLLISVDGMHQSDLAWYIARHPHSTLAKLTHGGIEYTSAETSNPSDSDPGGTALMTGGNPKSTGIYYDVEYSHKVDEPGAACTPGQPATGGDVIYDSPDDALASVNDFVNPANGAFPSFDENGSIFPGGVDKNPAAIMNLKFDPKTSLNPATFPVDPKTCKPITPWDYLGDNTIFQVIHGAGLRTAWSDKHEVYASFNGPGSNGKSIDDLFSPEIDSQAVEPNGVPYPQDDDWAHIDAATKQYDGYKVKAMLNEINGFDHSGKTKVGTPAIFGMNFQTVSVAQKIPSTPTTLIGPDKHGNYHTSAPQAGGYQWVHGKLVPGPVLSSALSYVDAQLGRMVARLHKDGLAGSTTIIITAKHGQSPQDPKKLITVQDGPIIDAINAAWAKKHPSNTKLIVAGTDDDLWQSYLSDNSQAADNFVKAYLWNHTAKGSDINLKPVTVKHSGLAEIWAGAAAAHFFGVSVGNGHYPDVFGKVQVGIVYAKPTKLAEHGGMNTGDRHVLMIVDGPGIASRVVQAPVETTQVAPTILSLLGLNPAALRAVRVEGTRVLPGLRHGKQ